VAPEWPRRQAPPENRQPRELRLPERALPERPSLELCSEFRAPLRQSYRPTRYVHK